MPSIDRTERAVDAAMTVRLESSGETRSLAAGTLSVGRAEENDWVITSPEGTSAVSPQHFSFAAGPEDCTVTDHGSTNGTLLNGSQLVPHKPAALSRGDMVQAGPHRFCVTAARAGREPFDAAAAPERRVPAGLLDTAGLSGTAGRPALEVLLRSLIEGGTGATGSGISGAGIPDTRMAAGLPGGGEEQADSSNPFVEASDLPPREVDAPSGPTRGVAASTGGPQTEALPPPPADRPADSVDQTLLDAFLAGAGVSATEIGAADPHAFLRDAGAVFATMADGLRQLLAVRTRIKSDVRLKSTQVGPDRNNPLKRSIDPHEAVLGLLRHRGPGYLWPRRAVDEAVRDLSAHEVAMLDAFQAALGEVLDVFDPDTLEARLGDTGVFALLIQGGRRASLWDLYVARYAEIAQAARRRSMGLFDDTFRDAYEKRADVVAARLPRDAEEAP